MFLHPSAIKVSKGIQCHRINCFLGAFRHWSAKLCSFWANQRLVCQLSMNLLVCWCSFSLYLFRGEDVFLVGNKTLDRQWVTKIYSKFTKAKKQGCKRRAEALGKEPPTKKNKNGKVSGSKSLKSTQSLVWA